MIYTSNFASLRSIRKHAPELRPVSIARHPPYWYKGLESLELAPTEAMLAEGYTPEQYAAMLDEYDPAQVLENLGEGAVLLCFEARARVADSDDACHRRMFAAWIKRRLGIIIPEWMPPVTAKP